MWRFPASLPVKVTLADEQLGTLVASYDATVAGHYIIRVMTGPKTHLPGSPFHVNVTCGPLHPPSCVVVRSSDLKMPPGSALSWTALVLPAGKEDTFTVLRCDKFGNRIPLAGNSNTPAEELSVQLIEASPRPADPSKALKVRFFFLFPFKKNFFFCYVAYDREGTVGANGQARCD